MSMKFLSNQQIINDINQSKKQYIKTRPEMFIKPYVNNREKYNLGLETRVHEFIGGFKSLGRHPFPYGTSGGDTSQPDPLITVGATSNIYGGGYNNDNFKTFSDFNNREIAGGALISHKFPLNEDYSSSDYSSSDEEGGFLSDSDEEGAGIYDSYIKPAGHALGNTMLTVGKHAFHDVIVPIGKELLRNAILKAVGGGNKIYGGYITGTREEFIHILKKIDPNFKPHRKHTKDMLRNEVYGHLKGFMKPKDLKTLHYLDTLASYNIDPNQNYGAIKTDGNFQNQGGLNGSKAELEEIIKMMYPTINFKKMKKEEIIKIIKNGHMVEEKQEIIHEPKIIHETEIIKKKRGRPAKPKEPKEPKKRGRPAKPKEPKEPKKRGRKPKSKTESTEPKKRGRKPKSKIEKLVEPDQALKEFDNLMDSITKPKNEGGKIKKLVGTKRGNRARGAIVAEVMKKHGLNLAQASKYVSKHNLY